MDHLSKKHRKILNSLKPFGVGSVVLIEGHIHIVGQISPGKAQLFYIGNKDGYRDFNRRSKAIVEWDKSGGYRYFSDENILALVGPYLDKIEPAELICIAVGETQTKIIEL